MIIKIKSTSSIKNYFNGTSRVIHEKIVYFLGIPIITIQNGDIK
jgi:hypothetical protein